MGWTVIGVGSRGARDDAIGLLLVEALAQSTASPGLTPLLWEDADALTVAHDLLALTEPVLIVDCANMGLEGGAWRHFRPRDGELKITRDALSTHGLGMAEALEIACGLGFDHPVRVFGVQPFDLSPQPGLTPEMAQRMPELLTGLQTVVTRLLADWPPEVPEVQSVLPVPLRFVRPVLALGIESKNALAFGEGTSITLFQPCGDLADPMARSAMEQAVTALLDHPIHPPEVLAVDLHPDLYPSVLGRRLAAERSLKLVVVQHHQAHAAACMAEHGLHEALAVTCDGMGYGLDGTIWGAELLHLHPQGWSRLGSFAPIPLPGGDAAVRQPVRQLLARLLTAGVTIDAAWQERLGVSPLECDLWSRQCGQGIHAPMSHAAGRLFDAFAAWLGSAPRFIAHEGEAAMGLEAVAHGWQGKPEDLPPLPFALREEAGLIRVDWSPLFAALPVEPVPEAERPAWAYGFHRACAEALAAMVQQGVQKTGLQSVVLSGGVFLNRLLKALLLARLQELNVQLFDHRRLTTGDGSLAVGQLWVAGRKDDSSCV
ncbi:MAG: hydrogenase maturation protease [Magnetococcales bacterium]|nr:hydrogenase maturation protease [Magnetococcales bacterium]